MVRPDTDSLYSEVSSVHKYMYLLVTRDSASYWLENLENIRGSLHIQVFNNFSMFIDVR